MKGNRFNCVANCECTGGYLQPVAEEECERYFREIDCE